MPQNILYLSFSRRIILNKLSEALIDIYLLDFSYLIIILDKASINIYNSYVSLPQNFLISSF